MTTTLPFLLLLRNKNPCTHVVIIIKEYLQNKILFILNITIAMTDYLQTSTFLTPSRPKGLQVKSIAFSFGRVRPPLSLSYQKDDIHSVSRTIVLCYFILVNL
jgi:hypothetical protein